MASGRLATALRLGRVSNLPTVWTNVVAARALAGGDWLTPATAGVVVSMSLAYVGGMYLNDAFDAAWDAGRRPDRPIPAGEVSRGTVFGAGFALLATALLALAPWAPGRALMAAAILCALIVLYNVSHKHNPASPLIMALCRVGVYATSALTVAREPRAAVYAGAGALLVYLMALTFVAKHEDTFHARGHIGKLIAGVAGLDAALLLLCGRWGAAALAIAAGLLTLRWQRRVPGT